MTLTDLASVGRLVSAIAIVFSFVFLAIEMRRSHPGQLARSGGVKSRGGIAGDLTNDSELRKFYEFAAATFRSYEDSFLQFENERLEGEKWAAGISTLKNLLADPAYRAAWKAERNSIGASYRQFVDRLVYEAKIESESTDAPAHGLAEELADPQRPLVS